MTTFNLMILLICIGYVIAYLLTCFYMLLTGDDDITQYPWW